MWRTQRISLYVLSVSVSASLAPAESSGQERRTRVVRPTPLADLGTNEKLTVVYFVPQEREFTRGHEEKIPVLLTFVNELYRDAALTWNPPGTDTRSCGLDFEFRSGDPPKVFVHVVRGEHREEWYRDTNLNSPQQYGKIAHEVRIAFPDAATRSFLIFAETYDRDAPAPYEWLGGLAQGGPHLAIFSAWILRDELCATTVKSQLRFFADATPIPGRIALGHGRMPSPRFEFIEDGFGAVAHELGHSLAGLPHDDDPASVMSNGFRNLRENFIRDPSRRLPPAYFPPAARAKLRECGYVH